MIRPVTENDAAAIAEIYNHYVLHTVVTFEEVVVPADEMVRRIREVTATHPWLVRAEGDEILGYVYARPWHVRSAYRNSVESTIYLRHDATGRGLGRELYSKLLDILAASGLHCAVGGISLPNPASVALHERLGFVASGRLPELGFKFGEWVDVGYWWRRLNTEPQ